MPRLGYYKGWSLTEYVRVAKGNHKYIISASWGGGLYSASNSRDVIMKKWKKLKNELKAGKYQ